MAPRRPKAIKVLLDVLREAIDKGVMKDLCLEVAAPINMQAKRSDNAQYRTVGITRGEEMMPSGVRLGFRGEDKVIFEFKPVDPSGPYDQYELNDTKVWTAFPDLESLVLRAMDYEATDTDGNPVRFAQIKHRFLDAIEEQQTAKAEEIKVQTEEKVKNHYENHPLFGVWG